MMHVPNATTQFIQINDIGGIILMLFFILIVCLVIVVLLTAAKNIEKYRKFKKIFTFLITMCNYATYGLLTVIVVSAPCLLAWLGFQQATSNTQASLEFLKWIGIFVLVFIGLAGLGYLTKNRIWKRLFEFHKQEVELKEKSKPSSGGLK